MFRSALPGLRPGLLTCLTACALSDTLTNCRKSKRTKNGKNRETAKERESVLEIKRLINVGLQGMSVCCCQQPLPLPLLLPFHFI